MAFRNDDGESFLSDQHLEPLANAGGIELFGHRRAPIREQWRIGRVARDVPESARIPRRARRPGPAIQVKLLR